MIVLIAMAALDRQWTPLAIAALHTTAIALHWTDEWLETHTPYGLEFVIGNALSGDAACEGEARWIQDAPSDAFASYVGSGAHVAIAAAAGARVHGALAPVLSASPLDRVAQAVASSILWSWRWLGDPAPSLAAVWVGGGAQQLLAMVAVAAALHADQRGAAGLVAFGAVVTLLVQLAPLPLLLGCAGYAWHRRRGAAPSA